MSTNDESKKKERIWYLRAVIKGFFALPMIIAIILLLAGRINYWQGWVFGAVTVIIVLIQSILFIDRIELAKERLKPGPGTKWWDKIFWAFYVPAFFGVIIVGSLDAGRHRWTAELPAVFYVISYIIYVFSNFMNLRSMWVNKFFSSTVRIQADRNQVVVQDGPYRFIRHPGYVGGILMAISSSLVLGSLWGLIPAGVVMILLITRTYLEDTTLQKELAGYTDYTRKVKYRLLPGVW